MDEIREKTIAEQPLFPGTQGHETSVASQTLPSPIHIYSATSLCLYCAHELPMCTVEMLESIHNKR